MSDPHLSRSTRPRSAAATGGFTLLETMVALAVFGLIGAAIYGIIVRTNQSQSMGSSLAEAQQNARAALDVILRDLRQAGYGIDSDSDVPVETASEYRVTLVIDRDADGTIDPGDRVTYFLDNDAADPIAAASSNPDDYVLRRVISTADDELATPESGKGEMVAYGVTQRTLDHDGWNVRLLDYFDEDGVSLIGNGDDPDEADYGKTVADSLLGKPAGGARENQVRSVRVEIVTESARRHPETHTYPQMRVSGTIHPRNMGLQSYTLLGDAAPVDPTGTGTGTGTGTATGTVPSPTGTGTGTGTVPPLPDYQPPLRVPSANVLSLLAADLHERDSLEGSNVRTDHQHDYDLIMTTKAGVDNLAVWWGGYPDAYSGNVLYRATPNYKGRSTRDLSAIAAGNLDDSSNDYVDIVTSVRVTDTSGGFEVWLDQAPLNEGRVGVDSTTVSPNGFYSSGSGYGRSIALGDMDHDGDLDVVLGTRTDSNNGAIEIWYNGGLGTFLMSRRLTAGGEVNAVRVADMNGDGWLDIVAGTKTSSNNTTGQVEIWINQRDHNYSRNNAWSSGGKVNALAAGRMDDDGDIDLVAGTRTGNNRGEIELWLNNGAGILTLADEATADGEVHAVAVGTLDYDNEGLDIAAGTSARSVQAWYCDPGALIPSAIVPAFESWADANTGGIVNSLYIVKVEAPWDNPSGDSLGDIICGTAVDAANGEIVVYFNPYVWNLNP